MRKKKLNSEVTGWGADLGSKSVLGEEPYLLNFSPFSIHLFNTCLLNTH